MIALLRRGASWIAGAGSDAHHATGRWHLPAIVRVAASTAFLIAVFIVLRRIVTTACLLPDAYSSKSILAACTTGRTGLLTPALAGYAMLLFAVPPLRRGWQQFEGGGLLRVLIGAVVIMLAWSGGAYGYNAWYGESHLVDRALLGAMALLVLWRPAFVFPFLLVYWPIMWQFANPPLGFEVLLAEFRPLAHLLTLFAAVFLVHAAGGSRSMDAFLFLALCLVAANFWVPARAKLEIGWITHGHLYFLLPNAYTHGWLGFLDPDTIAAAASRLAAVDWPMRVATLLVEGGALFMLAGERTARLLLAACTALLGVFFLTIGYFFWKWMVLHAALWLVLFGTTRAEAAAWRRQLFTPARFAVSIVAIAAAPYWSMPAALAWFDTPLTSTLQFEAAGESSTTYDLPADFFSPYENHLAMGLFVGRLTPVPLLAASYGVTSIRARADALLDAREPGDIIRLEREAAGGSPSAPDEAFARTFVDFVRRTVAASNERAGARAWHALFRPPPFLWTFPHGRAYDGGERIRSVRIYHVSSFFDGRRYHLFRRDLLRTVPVPAGRPGG